MSNYYRIINKTGGYTWMQTCATLISNNTSSNSNKSTANTPTPTSSSNGGSNNEDNDQSIICVNYVLRYN